MTNQSHRAVIMGLGYIGGADQVSGDALGQLVVDLDGTHIDALANHPRVEVVAGSSRDLGRRERFTERTGIGTYADWREMLEQEKPDVVSVATYTPVHKEMTVASARQGVRAIFCEKPIANTAADGHDMVDACDESGSLLAINHNRRFNPNYRRLRDHIAAGGLGELTSVTAQWSTGRLGNVGTHVFDAIRLITGRRVEAVSGTLDLAGKPDCRGPAFQDPGGWGVMRLEGGLMTTVDAADYARVPMVIGFNGTEGRATTGGEEVRIEYWDGRNEEWPSPRAQATSMDVAVVEIVDWLEGTAPFPYPAVEAVETLEAIAGFHLSHARSGAWVELPLQGENRNHVVNSG